MGGDAASNEANVGMTATETITSNPRVLGADPLVVYKPAADGEKEIPGGIGEEDIVHIVLPYIRPQERVSGDSEAFLRSTELMR